MISTLYSIRGIKTRPSANDHLTCERLSTPPGHAGRIPVDWFGLPAREPGVLPPGPLGLRNNYRTAGCWLLQFFA